MGTLNFQFDCKESEARNLLFKGAIDQLKRLDDLCQLQKYNKQSSTELGSQLFSNALKQSSMNGLFNALEEADFVFAPNSKFERGTNLYSTKALPGYTERILYVKNEQFVF
jgi:hypothetical protein